MHTDWRRRYNGNGTGRISQVGGCEEGECGMAREWHQTTTVHDGGRVEVVVQDLVDGEEVEVVVRRNGTPSGASGNHPQFGSARGRVVIQEDFDAPLDEFKEYM